MHYAKKGIITPEMEYIAIRENQRIDELKDEYGQLAAYHEGVDFDARIQTRHITPEFVREEVAAGARHNSQQHKPSRNRAHDNRAELPS